MRTQLNSWRRRFATRSAMTDGPFSHCEAAVWNFLLFWCLGDSGATIDALREWLSDTWSEAEVYIAIASLTSRGAIESDEDGYFPIVAGKAYRNMEGNWDDIITLAIDPDRTLH
jgi:hypothetical protein